MKEIKVTKVIQNERRELVVSFIVKEGDFSETEAQLLREAKLEGNMLDIEFTGFEKGNVNEQRNKNLQYLGALMNNYSDIMGESTEYLTKDLYKKYGINSRTELTDEQLNSEIESYKAGIKYHE